MAGSADFVVRYNDFSGGDYGVLDPAKAEKNQFAGTNVIRYNSGLLGVRPGLKPLTLAWPGGSGTHTQVPGPYGFDVFGTNLLLALGDTTWKIPFNDTTPVPVGYQSYPGAANGLIRYAQGNQKLYATVDGVLYRHDANGDTTAISTPQPLSTVVRWNYSLVGVDLNVPYRLWYSSVTEAGPQFDTWGTNNYLDVGSNLPITALKPVFNALYCGKADGWWGVTGILGQQSTVRFRVTGNGPPDQRQVTVTTDNRILYWPNEPVPAWFNGDRVYLDRNYRLEGFDTGFAADTVIATPTGKRLFMLGEQRDAGGDPVASGMMMWEESAWTSHLLPTSLSAAVPQDVRAGTELPEGVVFFCKSPTTVGETVEVVSFSHDLDRPGHATDRWASPTDLGAAELVDGSVKLPAFYDGQGRQVRVRNVIVQFRKWASGVAASSNRLEVKVVPLGRYEGGSTDTEPQVWQEPSANSSADGTDDSWRVGVGAEGWGNGFQVVFPRLRGVALRDVIVLCEVRTQRV